MEKKTLSLKKITGMSTGSKIAPRFSDTKKGLVEVVVATTSKRQTAPLNRTKRRETTPPKKPSIPSVDENPEAEITRTSDKLQALKSFQEQESQRLEQEFEEQKKRQEEERRRLEKEAPIATEKPRTKAEIPPDIDIEESTLLDLGTSPDKNSVPIETDPSRKRTPPARRKKIQKRETEPRPSGKDRRKRRENAKIDVNHALSDEVKQKSHAAHLRRQERKKRKAQETATVKEKVVREVQLPESIIVQELANRMAERVTDVVKMLMKNGVMVTQNQTIDADTAEIIIAEFGHRTIRISAADVEDVIETQEDLPKQLKPRPPVISVMGHVDHGKTSLLDAIRKTNVTSGEAGGITQHIGAYQVVLNDGKKITFLDTPGHAAFTEMRARGALITDIVVLVVAADDAVMPQTIEAINHAQAAEVPVIIAINKIDVAGADQEKVRNDLLRHNIIVEKRSGEVLDVEISALNGTGIDKLLEAISLQAELLELTANPDRQAVGIVIESSLDIGRGAVATVLVQKGTIHKGDVFVIGDQWGKVRALVSDAGERIQQAGPSMPVEVIGLNGTPKAGDILNVVENESQAKEISRYRQSNTKGIQRTGGKRINIYEKFKLGNGGNGIEDRSLNLVIKADVHGSMEAIVQAVEKIGNEEVRVRVLHSGVGAITETDISLAEAHGAHVIGFNVRANASALTVAMQKAIDIQYYSVIYSLLDDIHSLASNQLPPKIKENFIGSAEILEVFKITGAGTVAGCRVTDGTVRRSAGIRLLRENIVIHEGTLKTLKRFKDEVNEVLSGQECGMAFENYANIRKGDFIEVFEREEIKRSL